MQLILIVEQHYRSLIRRFVGAASFDGAIRGGPTLASCVDTFPGSFNISFTHACTIKNSSSDFVFKSSLRHSSAWMWLLLVLQDQW